MKYRIMPRFISVSRKNSTAVCEVIEDYTLACRNHHFGWYGGRENIICFFFRKKQDNSLLKIATDIMFKQPDSHGDE